MACVLHPGPVQQTFDNVTYTSYLESSDTLRQRSEDGHRLQQSNAGRVRQVARAILPHLILSLVPQSAPNTVLLLWALEFLNRLLGHLTICGQLPV